MKKISALQLFYLSMALMVIMFLIGFPMDKVDKTLDVWAIIVGFINIIYPTWLMEALQEKSAKSNWKSGTIKSDGYLKVISIFGGVFFVSFGIIDLFLKPLW